MGYQLLKPKLLWFYFWNISVIKGGFVGHKFFKKAISKSIVHFCLFFISCSPNQLLHGHFPNGNKNTLQSVRDTIFSIWGSLFISVIILDFLGILCIKNLCFSVWYHYFLSDSLFLQKAQWCNANMWPIVKFLLVFALYRVMVKFTIISLGCSYLC